VEKTVVAKLETSKEEEQLLEEQWEQWQNKLQGEDAKLYSGIEQQAEWKELSEGHGIDLRNDLIKIKQENNQFFLKTPHRKVYGGIWHPLKMADKHKKDLEKGEICDSLLIPKKNEWFIHIVVEIDTTVDSSRPEVVIGVDIGEKNLAGSVALVNRKVQDLEYHGKKRTRTVQSHYRKLRENLQKKKCWNKLQEIGNREQRVVNDICHKASRQIVDKAEKYKQQGYTVAIAIGDLSGVRNQKGKRKSFDRRINSFPFHKLTRYIQYKAEEAGINCELVDEYNTSQKCNRCGCKGSRNNQGEFKCGKQDCEISKYNADFNASINIGRRLLDKFRRPLTSNRASVNRLQTPPSINNNQAEVAV